jgi:hypothetical protein
MPAMVIKRKNSKAVKPAPKKKAAPKKKGLVDKVVEKLTKKEVEEVEDKE